MPKKFRIRKVLPKLILREKTFSPKKLRNIILTEYNVEMTPQNISMWISRHPEIVKDLEKKIGEDDAQHENIRFERDYWITKDFKSSIPIIQEWIDTMIGRKVSEDKIRARVLVLRKVCMGVKGTEKKLETIIEWSLHPLALTEEKALKYIVELNRRGYTDTTVRLTVRNFLKYGKGEEPKKISGDKGEYGKYAHLDAPDEKKKQILDWLTLQDYEIGTFCRFLHKTATRAEASKNVEVGHINPQKRIVTVWDKGKRRKKQKWTKYLDDEILYALKPLMDDGRLFVFKNVDLTRARKLCWEAYRKFIPELVSEIPMPLHLWRHFFAQAMLQKTDYNYDLVAQLGGWHPQTLRENYGAMPQAVVKKAGLKHIPTI